MWAWQEIDCRDKNRQDERVREQQGSSIANMTFFRKREITIERGKPQENKNNG
jgi:hypothetical protein